MKLFPMSELPPVGSPFADATLFLLRLDGPKDLRAPYNEFGLAQFSKRLTFGEWRWGRIDDLAASLTAEPKPAACAPHDVDALRQENQRLVEAIRDAAASLRRVANGGDL